MTWMWGQRRFSSDNSDYSLQQEIRSESERTANFEPIAVEADQPSASIPSTCCDGGSSAPGMRAVTRATVTRADLDAAIEQGDWAAIGATAALLAAACDSQSFSSSSQTSGTSEARESSTTAIPSIDASREAVLNHLAESGDWEGVVLAAAKFEAADSERSGTKDSDSSAGSSDAATASHASTTDSETQQWDEIRTEVEALVRRVAPEEIDNVDEMMLHYKGREEELVETLRTCLERAVAQKARAQLQRAANKGGITVDSVPSGTKKSGNSAARFDAAIASHSPRSTTDGEDPNTTRKRAELRAQVEALVRQVAPEEIDNIDDMMLWFKGREEELIETLRTPIQSGTQFGQKFDFDNMMDRGGWAGTVTAVCCYGQVDTPVTTTVAARSDAGFGLKTSVSPNSCEAERLRQIHDEKDALPQAEIWMAIAEQRIAEGAHDAAEWAIARSLWALRAAEQKGDLAQAERSMAINRWQNEHNQ